MSRRVTMTALLLYAILAPAHAAEAAPGAPKHVSILASVLDCERYEGALVRVIGAVAIAYDRQALCPTREHLDADTINCLWLVVDEHFTADDLEHVERSVQKGEYLNVEGRITCDDERHGAIYGAGLYEISTFISFDDGEIVWSRDPQIDLSSPDAAKNQVWEELE